MSSASAWEIATKFAKGKLPTAAAMISNLPQIVTDEGFEHLPITMDHMVRSVFLQGDHRDPFDRILAARSIVEDLTLISIDETIPDLGATLLW